jgi:hypothetical protein
MKITKEQADVARKISVLDILHHYGRDPLLTISLSRVWPGGDRVMTFFADCPICRNEMWIDNSADRWFCATCRDQGDGIGLVRFLTGCTLQQAIAALSGTSRMPTRDGKATQQATLAKHRHIEHIAQQYGLVLTETTERPVRSPLSDLAGLGSDWPFSRWGGTTLVTTCPICTGPLFVYINVDSQVWTCRQCNMGYSCRRPVEEGDPIDLVRHLTGCSLNQAIYYLGGGGPQPRLKIRG